MTKNKLKINYLAVIVTGVIAFLFSIFWYSPIMFGKIWEHYRNTPNPSVPQWTMVFSPLRELIASYVIAVLIIRLNLTNWKLTMQLVLLLWLAFHAVGMAGAILWDNMQWQLGMVHSGDWLIKMIFMGILLTIWLNKKNIQTKK